MVRFLPRTGFMGKLHAVGINLQDAYNVGVWGTHHVKSYLIKGTINVRIEMSLQPRWCWQEKPWLHRTNTQNTISKSMWTWVEWLFAILRFAVCLVILSTLLWITPNYFIILQRVFFFTDSKIMSRLCDGIRGRYNNSQNSQKHF